MLEELLIAKSYMVGFCGPLSHLGFYFAELLLATTLLPDTDNIATAITSLAYLTKSVSVDSLLQVYKDETFFRIYLGERNPSISVDCNTFVCLLMKKQLNAVFCTDYQNFVIICRQSIQGLILKKWVRNGNVLRAQGH